MSPSQRTLARRAQAMGMRRLEVGPHVGLGFVVLQLLAAAQQRGATLPSMLRISRRGMRPHEVALLRPISSHGAPVMQIAPDIETALDLGDTLEDVVIHELGHLQHWCTVGEARFLALAQSRFKGTRTLEVVALVDPNPPEDPCEFVAETFRALSDGRRLAKAVLRLYRRLGGPAPLTPIV